MTTADAIYAKLAASVIVTIIVGTSIYPIRLRQGALPPYVIYQQVGADPDSTHGEASSAVHRMFQFACFASTPEAATTLRDAIITALDGVKLANGDTPSLEDERDGDFDDATELHRADADFIV